MKIVYIFQNERSGGHSIRELFQTIAKEVSRRADVCMFTLGTRGALLADLRKLWRLDADLYHITGNVYYLAPFLPKGKVVLTIHDIGHYTHGLKGWRRRVYGWLWFRLPLRYAPSVVCISKETGKTLKRHFRIDAGRLAYVPCCVSGIFVSDQRSSFENTPPIILQVGTSHYKNVPRVVNALKGVPCRLVLVGRIDEPIATALAKNGITWENHVDLSHLEVARLYHRCDMVVFASLGEGFGVPILEAQAAQRPLVTSNVSPLREVAGDGACLVDPFEVSSIRAGIVRIIHEPTYRKAVVEAGVRNVKDYSSSAVAARYLSLYQSLLSNDGDTPSQGHRPKK